MNNFQIVFVLFCAGIFIWLISGFVHEAKEQRKKIIEELTERGIYGKRKDDIKDPDEIVI